MQILNWQCPALAWFTPIFYSGCHDTMEGPHEGGPIGVVLAGPEGMRGRTTHGSDVAGPSASPRTSISPD